MLDYITIRNGNAYVDRSKMSSMSTRKANLGVTTIRNENVRGLDVPMHNPLRVCRVQRICNFCPQLQQLLDRERFSGEPVLQ
jgi:hypothetical protein